MAGAIRPGGMKRTMRGGNRYLAGGVARRARRIRPGKALVWLFGLGTGAAFVALVSLALLVGFRWLTTSSFFSLKEITVTGNLRLEADEIIEMAGVELGANTLDVKISDVEERLAADAWTESVAVRRVLPDGLAIHVVERRPHWWVRTGRGLFYAEADGAVIAEVDPGKLAAMPVLDTTDAPAELAGRIRELAVRFDAAGLPFGVEQAAWVRLMPQRVELYFEGRGLRISAATDDWGRNMERLAAVWADLDRRGEAQSAKEIRIFGGKVWVTA